MARKGWGRHSTVATGADSGDQVSVNAWNADLDKQGMLGFSPQTATITISSGALTVTDSITVAAAETGTTDTIDTIAITNTNEYDLIYLFADAGDTITLTNTSSPSSDGQIRTISDANETLSSTVPTILIRKGTYWYGYGGGVVNSLTDIGDVTITSASQYQTLTYNGSNWINNAPDKLYYVCKNAGGSTIAKGKFVYISGYDTFNSYIEVSLAANTSASTMPAFGITMEAISAGSTGKVLQQGKMTGLNTDGIAEGTTLYIGTSGDWVTTKPTGTALIQNVGEVLKDNISDGHIHVGGSGRANDVPNIPDGKIWIGNASAVATAVTPSGDVTISNAGVTAIGSGVIVNDDINASAAIAISKLAASTITVSDGVTSTAVSLGNTVTFSGTSNEIEVGESSGTITIGLPNDVTITGDLTVNGTTTTINSTTLTVDDKNIEIGSVSVPSDTTANGGGITLKGATDKTLIWDSANSNWTSSEHWNIATGKEFKINNVKVLDATSLGSSVVSSSLTSVGTIATGTWNGTAVSEVYGGTNQTSYATGDILYASGANTLSKLTAGTDGYVLTLASGVPTWAAAAGGATAELNPKLQSSSYSPTYTSPTTEGTDPVSIWVGTIDSNNQGVYAKIKKNGSYVTVQIA